MYALYVNECIGITKVLLWNPYGKFSLELYGIVKTVNKLYALLIAYENKNDIQSVPNIMQFLNSIFNIKFISE